MLYSGDIQIFIFHQFESCDVIMSISTRGRVHFEYIFCRKSFGYEIQPTNRYKYRQFFDKNLHILKDWMFSSGRFQFTTLSQLMRNQL